MSKVREGSGYQCPICSETIADDRSAVALAAVWMADWQKSEPDAPSQSFFVHSGCLKKIWGDAYPWEDCILYGEDGAPVPEDR